MRIYVYLHARVKIIIIKKMYNAWLIQVVTVLVTFF